MASFTELGKVFGLEGRFLRGNSICLGQVKSAAFALLDT